MEDLKKQTAIRLAQEQEQTQFFPTFHQCRGSGGRSMHSLPEQKQALSQSYTFPHQAVVAHNSMDPCVMYEVMQDMGGLGIGIGATSPGCGPNGIQQHALPTQIHHSTIQQQYQLFEMQQSESFEGISPSGARYGIDARGRYPPARTSGSGSSSSFSVASAKAVSMSHSDSPGAPQNKSSKAKLPHGLTVQELKEMTKARLQTDPLAPDIVDLPFSHATLPTRESPQSFLNQLHAHDLPPRSQISHNPTSGFVQVNRPMPPSRQDRQKPMNTPTGPPGFQSFPSNSPLQSGVVLEHSHNQGLLQGRDSWHNQSKIDTWETASVASVNSTIGSEYYGSESVNGGPVGDEFGEVSFTRSRSYPSGTGLPNEYDVASSVGTGSYFDVQNQSVPNRQRACTLSPRPGLLHLHEDRPLGRMFGVPELTVPNFDYSNRNVVVPRPVKVEPFDRDTRSYNEGLVHSEALYGHFDGLHGQFNRPRTSSAPSISSSFLNGSNDNFQNSDSFTRLFSGELTNNVVGSVLNANDTCFSTGNEFTSVFRNSAGSGTGISQVDSPNSGLLRNGTNPWASSAASTSYTTATSVDEDAALAKDLGAMLRLSGSANIVIGGSFVRRTEPDETLLSSLRGGTSESDSSNLFSDLGSTIRSSPYNQGTFNLDIGSNGELYRN